MGSQTVAKGKLLKVRRLSVGSTTSMPVLFTLVKVAADYQKTEKHHRAGDGMVRSNSYHRWGLVEARTDNLLEPCG